MKAYKGFNKDMTCRGFQYKDGETYHEGEAKLCSSGFHACESPVDCFSYYDPANSVFHEVELEDICDERETIDTKVCAKTIKIGASIDLKGIIKATFEFVRSKCTNEKLGEDYAALTGSHRSALTGGYRSALTGGDRSALTGGDSSALTGSCSSALTGGDSSALTGGYRSALTGGYRSALTGGDSSALTGGDSSALTGGYRSALTGGYSSALTGGYRSALTGGDRSALTGGCRSALTGGYRSALTGGVASILRGGADSKFKGGLYSFFLCDKLGYSEKLKAFCYIPVAYAYVDGEKIKPDTWYTVINGEFVEVES